MPYAIVFFDSREGKDLRPTHRAAHFDHISQNLELILASGGICDDEDTPYGGLIILETEDRAIAEIFVKEDPFFKAGIYGEYKILRWRKGFYNKQRFV